MNYIKHLTGFFDHVIKDDRLNPTHISLYVALFQFWNVNRFVNPISISRSEVMRISKISSKATYHKCMKELHLYGYLVYDPSYNPFRGSLVHLISFEGVVKPPKKTQTNKKPSPKHALNKQQSTTEQAVIPYINNTNFTNVRNLGTTKKIEEGRNKKPVKEKLREKKSEASAKDSPTQKLKRHGVGNHLVPGKANFVTTSATKLPVPPSLAQVQLYFNEKGFPSLEAQKFFNYYTSNGWLVGGKSPMRDWKAASRYWILNGEKFNNKQPQKQTAKHLHAPTGKNYSEPL